LAEPVAKFSRARSEASQATWPSTLALPEALPARADRPSIVASRRSVLPGVTGRRLLRHLARPHL